MDQELSDSSFSQLLFEEDVDYPAASQAYQEPAIVISDAETLDGGYRVIL